jgi:hypothetical protein
LHPGIKQLTETTFEFDGVIYYNKYLESKKDKLNNLLTTSKILKGKPNPNLTSWGFLLADGSWDITKDKYKYKSGVLLCKKGKRFDLLEQFLTGQIYKELSCQTTEIRV